MGWGQLAARAAAVVVTVLLAGSAARAQVAESSRDLVSRYNRVLKELKLATGDGWCCECVWPDRRVQNLIEILRMLAALEISDPTILPSLHFVDSYKTLFVLRDGSSIQARAQAEDWDLALRQVDLKARTINGFENRPAARWLLDEARSLNGLCTPAMLDGFIEREQGTARIAEDGNFPLCSGSDGRKLAYVILKCLLPGQHDLREAQRRMYGFPPTMVNPRVLEYWEVRFSEPDLSMRRNYTLRPFPGYHGTLETYHRIVFEDRERLVTREENARQGRFVIESENAAVFVQAPPHGIVFALILTGRYWMQDVFELLAGDKRLTEPLKAMCILRQAILRPELGEAAIVEAGLRDFRERQWKPCRVHDEGRLPRTGPTAAKGRSPARGGLSVK